MHWKETWQETPRSGAQTGRCTRYSCGASAALITCMLARCTQRTPLWRSTMHATCTPGGMRASASGLSVRPTSPRRARTRRTRSSHRAATRCTGIPRSTRSPTRFRTSEMATMGFDTAYEAISEEHDTGHRWAFGTGFTDPLAGVDTAVPAGVDGIDLAAYCLMLGDDALIMSHRLQQWLARAPELEEETALANIALDLLGQARLLLSRAGAADGSGRGEDDYAFGRAEREVRNVRLAEVADADFGGLIARLLVFSTWRLALLARLRDSRDPVLTAVGARGVSEVAYHRDYAAQWTARLAGGTDYSRARIEAGLAAIAPLTPELFAVTNVERRLVAAGVAADPAALREEFDAVIGTVLAEEDLAWPDAPALAGVAGQAGRHGIHTEATGYLLAELQSIARSHPGATW